MKEIQDAITEETGSLAQLFAPGLRKALFVALFLAIVSELSGITVVLYYGPGILKKAGFSLGAALGGFVSIGLVNVLFTLIAIWLIDSVGRRPLLFAGNAGAFAALATIGVLFRTGRTEGPLLVGMMCLFVACFAFSMGPIKWVVMSEIFPTRIRGRAMAIATLAVWVTDGVYNQMFPIVRDSLGVPGSFFVFAAVLAPQFFFVWKIMPETKGRTLEEIERSWK
jgi:MFS family permease